MSSRSSELLDSHCRAAETSKRKHERGNALVISGQPADRGPLAYALRLDCSGTGRRPFVAMIFSGEMPQWQSHGILAMRPATRLGANFTWVLLPPAQVCRTPPCPDGDAGRRKSLSISRPIFCAGSVPAAAGIESMDDALAIQPAAANRYAVSAAQDATSGVGRHWSAHDNGASQSMSLSNVIGRSRTRLPHAL